jgi:hypothetical protein
MSTPEPPDVERLRAALARLDEDPGWPDVDAERMYAALHGELDAETRRQIVDETIRNPRAAAAWRLARELDPGDAASPAGGLDHEDATYGGHAWTRRWLPLAATVALALGAAWQFQVWRDDAPVYRGEEVRAISSALPAGQPLSRTRPELRWTPIDGARYRVRVLTPELDVLDESGDLEAPAYMLGPAVLSRIGPGTEVLWQVEARTPGSAPLVSPTFSTRVQ